MSAADDFAKDVRDALRRHGPAMAPGEPVKILHALTIAAVQATYGPDKAIEFLETALRAERELEAASKRRIS